MISVLVSDIEMTMFKILWFAQKPLLRIRDVYPGSESFPCRIQDQKDLRTPDPHPHQRAPRITIRGVHSGSGSWFFTHPGSRIQGSKGSRIRIRNTAKKLPWLVDRTLFVNSTIPCAGTYLSLFFFHSTVEKKTCTPRYKRSLFFVYSTMEKKTFTLRCYKR